MIVGFVGAAAVMISGFVRYKESVNVCLRVLKADDLKVKTESYDSTYKTKAGNNKLKNKQHISAYNKV